MFLFWWVDIKNPLTNHFLYLLPAIVIPISALLGLMTLRRPLTPLAFLLLAVLAIHYFSVMVTFYVARIRLSVEPVMFLLAAGFWCRFIYYFKGGPNGRSDRLGGHAVSQ
jgi:hypothetical protein